MEAHLLSSRIFLFLNCVTDSPDKWGCAILSLFLCYCYFSIIYLVYYYMSMPSRTASQPSHLHRREPALSCREAWESTSLPNLPPQLHRRLLEHSVCRGSCPFNPATGQAVTKYIRQGIWKQTQRIWSSFLRVYFWPWHAECKLLVPQPGIKPAPPAVGARSLNHRTTKEVPGVVS